LNMFRLYLEVHSTHPSCIVVHSTGTNEHCSAFL
jgi:hypothetical protein